MLPLAKDNPADRRLERKPPIIAQQVRQARNGRQVAMIFFLWKEEYELGLPQIDLQHTMIVNMINELYASIDAGEEEEATARIFAKLMRWIEDHFAAEEKAMREHDYPDQKAHLAEHEAFRKRAYQLYDRHRAGETIAAYDLANFLKDWLKKHIARVDKNFGAFVFQLNEEARAAFFRQNPAHPLAK